MKKENNQADLFSEPAEKKEDAMKQEEKGSNSKGYERSPQV
jgi:hypothetical protein